MPDNMQFTIPAGTGKDEQETSTNQIFSVRYTISANRMDRFLFLLEAFAQHDYCTSHSFYHT
jgi:hypothetical protein